MTPEQGGLTALVALVTGVLTWFSKTLRDRRDSRTAQASAQAAIADSTWDRAQSWMSRVDNEMVELREANRILTAKHNELWAENQRLTQENAEQRALIEENVDWILQWERWFDDGATPPPPRMTWRMREHLAAFRDRRT